MRYVFCKSHKVDRLLLLQFENLFEKSNSNVSDGGTLTLVNSGTKYDFKYEKRH